MLGNTCKVVIIAAAFAFVGLFGHAFGADHYVGSVAGGPKDARIAVVIDGKQLVAYPCSGEAGFNQRYAVWFTGALADDGSFSGSLKDASIKLQAGSDTLTGQLNYRNGKTYSFKAMKVPQEGITGLYRAEAGDLHVIGAIIDEEHLAVGNSRNKKTGNVVPLRAGTRLPRPGTTTLGQQQLQVQAQNSLTVNFPNGLLKPPKGIKVEPTGIVKKRTASGGAQFVQPQRVLDPARLPKGVFVNPR